MSASQFLDNKENVRCAKADVDIMLNSSSTTVGCPSPHN